MSAHSSAAPTTEPSSPTPPRSLRDDLAELLARAVREGDLETAGKLLEAVRGSPKAAPTNVTDLAAERQRRGGTS